MVKKETVYIRWATYTDAGHKDLTVQLSGAEGDRGVWRLKLSPGKPDYSVALLARYYNSRYIDIDLDVASDNRYPQTLVGKYVTQIRHPGHWILPPLHNNIPCFQAALVAARYLLSPDELPSWESLYCLFRIYQWKLYKSQGKSCTFGHTKNLYINLINRFEFNVQHPAFWWEGPFLELLECWQQQRELNPHPFDLIVGEVKRQP